MNSESLGTLRIFSSLSSRLLWEEFANLLICILSLLRILFQICISFCYLFAVFQNISRLTKKITLKFFKCCLYKNILFQLEEPLPSATETPVPPSNPNTIINFQKYAWNSITFWILNNIIKQTVETSSLDTKFKYKPTYIFLIIDIWLWSRICIQLSDQTK